MQPLLDVQELSGAAMSAAIVLAKEAGFAGLLVSDRQAAELGDAAQTKASDGQRGEPSDAASVRWVRCAMALAPQTRRESRWGPVLQAAGRAGARGIVLQTAPMARGSNGEQWASQLSGALARLAADAQGLNLRVLIENGGGSPLARNLWHVMEQLPFGQAGVCWNALTGWKAGQTPQIALPMLGRRIELVVLRDCSGQDAQPVPLGSGVIPVQTHLHLLKGIGFTGDLAVSSAADWSAAQAILEPPAPKAPAKAPRPAAARA